MRQNLRQDDGSGTDLPAKVLRIMRYSKLEISLRCHLPVYPDFFNNSEGERLVFSTFTPFVTAFDRTARIFFRLLCRI